MEVVFINNKEEDLYASFAALNRMYGTRMAEKIVQRIGELQAAETPQKLLSSARFHEHQGKRAGLYSVDLVHPYRLILLPIGEYTSWVEIKVVQIYEVFNSHK